MTNREQEQLTASKRTGSGIPTFKTIEEEAEFWDSHDSTEFEDELEDVTDVRFIKAQ